MLLCSYLSTMAAYFGENEARWPLLFDVVESTTRWLKLDNNKANNIARSRLKGYKS